MDQKFRRTPLCRARLATAFCLAFAGCGGAHPEPADLEVGSSKVTNYAGPIVGLAGKCLDASTGSVNGTKVDLRACKGGAAQHWTLTKGEILGPGGKCLSVRGSSADGTQVELWDCQDSPGQQWSYDATNQEIVGTGGKCVNVKGNRSADGTPAILWDCVGTANEQWQLTGTAAGTAASVSPSSLSFGSETVGTTSAIKTVTVTNTGTTTLSIGKATLSGDFTWGGTGTCNVGTSLAAGASCTITVVFKPSGAGARTGTLDVVDTAANSPQPVALSGSGTTSAGGGGSGGSTGSSPDECVASGGKLYYVSPSGSDSNPGTLGAPFRTLNHGADALNPGDTLCVRAGTYAEVVALRKSGSQGAPIVLRAYPGERPVIDPAGSGPGIWTVAKPIGWIEIRGFEVRRGVHGIDYQNAYNLTIADNWVHDNGSLNSGQTSQGIVGSGHDIAIVSNRIYDNGEPPYTSDLNHGLYVSGRHYLIANNVVYGNEAFGLQIAAYGCGANCVGAEYSGAVDWTVANNVFAFEKNRSGVVVWLPGTEYGDQAGVSLSNITLVNNIFYDNNPSNIGSAGSGILPYDDYAKDPSGVSWSSVVAKGNLFFSRTAVAPLPGGKISVGANVEGKDPLFANPSGDDFHPRAGSPALGAGQNLTGIGALPLDVDFGGTTRPASGAWDIGAYEHH